MWFVRKRQPHPSERPGIWLFPMQNRALRHRAKRKDGRGVAGASQTRIPVDYVGPRSTCGEERCKVRPMPTARRMWLLAGLIVIGAGGALLVTGLVGGQELEVFNALGFASVAVGVTIVVATSDR
jgi:hypothetical protein